MIRNLTLVFLGAFLLLLVSDFLIVYTSQIKIERAVDQGLDAAIIAGTQIGEHQRGYLRLDMNIAKSALKKVIQSNLDLDNEMSNNHYSESQLHSQVVYLAEIPRIEAEFKTKVKLVSGSLFGIKEWPVTVRKQTPYLAQFK